MPEDHADRQRDVRLETAERIVRIEVMLKQFIDFQNKLEVAQSALQMRTENVLADMGRRQDQMQAAFNTRISSLELKVAWAIGVGVALYTGFLFFAPALRQAMFGAGG